jgi:hypothetical protein
MAAFLLIKDFLHRTGISGRKKETLFTLFWIKFLHLDFPALLSTKTRFGS